MHNIKPHLTDRQKSGIIDRGGQREMKYVGPENPIFRRDLFSTPSQTAITAHSSDIASENQPQSQR